MSYQIKPLDWKRTHFNEIFQRKDPKLLKPQTWTAVTFFQTYKVYVSVGGAIFYQFSSMSHDDNGLPGFHSGADEILGKPKIKCQTIEEGQEICQKHYERLILSALTEAV